MEEIVRIKSDPETDYGYGAMIMALMLMGYIINHKKVYRLLEEYQLLHERRPKPKRVFVKHRSLQPEHPLSVLEMDIKFQWVAEYSRHAFILTILDCFTRTVLYWSVAYSIKYEQVKWAWEEVIVNYLQPHDMLSKGLIIEVRNDNDSRFAANKLQQFLKDNRLTQVFTHPYIPE